MLGAYVKTTAAFSRANPAVRQAYRQAGLLGRDLVEFARSIGGIAESLASDWDDRERRGAVRRLTPSRLTEHLETLPSGRVVRVLEGPGFSRIEDVK